MAFHYHVRTPEQMEARLAQSTQGNFISYIRNDYRIFQAQKNENCIRILPVTGLWNNIKPGHWGLDVWVHFGIGPSNGSVICLDQGTPQLGITGGDCPICQEMYRALKRRDDDLVKQLKPIKRVLVFLLNRKDDQGALVWGMPQTLDVKIFKASRSRENGTWKFPDDPEGGFDVYFDKEGEQLLTKYEGVQFASNPSRVPQKYLSWVEDNPLHEALVWRDYDEIQRIFAGGIGGDDDGGPIVRGRGSDRPPRGGGDGGDGGGGGYDRPSRGDDRPRAGNDRPSQRPPRESDDYRADDRGGYDDDRGRYADPRYASDPRDDTTDRHEPPWEDNPRREEPEEREPEPERRAAPPPRGQADPELTRPAIRRPGSAPPPRTNGAAGHAPSSMGADRADELRNAFLSGGRK
jgi:hypothetical protein